MPDPAPFTEPTWHVLQSLLHPAEGRPADLYLRTTPPDLTLPAAGPITLPTGATLSTDTFFGSFYRGYWHQHAGLLPLAVRITVRGHVRITIWHDTGARVEPVLSQTLRTEAARHLHLALPLPDLPAGGASRLHVEVKALGPAEVGDIDFVTLQAPARAVRLSIGLCTFNQEAYLAGTLDRLTRLADATPEIARIHLVNQGAPFASPAVQAHCAHPAIRLIQQRNLGGCGGFTRGLVQELATPDPATHQLLMDDDIVLDERLILRALRFLAYARSEIALGAGMFDSLRPRIMYEAGAFLRPENRIEPYAHQADLSDPARLGLFNAPVGTDYNAWWFCILPLADVARIGLPAPVFIRGDDFEYGQRLAAAGVPTVTLPGIGVWHEPFYAKPTSWQDYYDLRNRLIFGATYPAKVRQLSLAHVLGLVTTAALIHNYPSARLRLRAIRDYLDGPQVLADPEALHGRIMALARPDAPERLGPEWVDRPLAPAPRPKPTRMGPLVWHMVRALVRTGLGPVIRRDPVVLDIHATPLNVAGRSFVLTNGPRSFHLRFVPDRHLLWPLMVEAWRTGRRYRRDRAAADAAWAAAIPDYRKPAWWRACFGLDAD